MNNVSRDISYRFSSFGFSDASMYDQRKNDAVGNPEKLQPVIGKYHFY